MDVERDGLGRLSLSADEGLTRDDHRVVTDVAARSRRVRAVVLGWAVVAAVAVAILAALDWPAREYRDRDFFQYWAGARAIVEGADPYDLAWWTAFHEATGSRALEVAPQPVKAPAWTTPYPLWTLALFVPFALVPFAVATAAWLVILLTAVALGIAALIRGPLRGSRRDATLLVGIALSFQPLWLLPESGNITGLLFGLLAGSMALGARPVLAGVLLGVLAVKPQSVLIAAAAALWGRPRRARWLALGGAVAVVLTLVATSFAIRPDWPVGWLRSVAALQASAGSNATLWTLGRGLGIPALSVIAPVAMTGGVVAWVLWRRPGPSLLVAAAVPLSVALSPHGWTYDQLHLLISAAVAIGLVSGASATRRVSALVLIALAGVPVPWALYVLAFARNGEDLSALVPVIFFVALAVVDRIASGASRPASLR